MSFIFAGLAKWDSGSASGPEIGLDWKTKYHLKVGRKQREIFFSIEGNIRDKEFVLFSKK